MGPLIVSMNLSLDGSIEAQGEDDGSWLRIDEEVHGAFGELAAAADAFLYGRKVHEVTIAYWPDAADVAARPAYERENGRLWMKMPKLGVSPSLTQRRDRILGTCGNDRSGAVANERRLSGGAARQIARRARRHRSRRCIGRRCLAAESSDHLGGGRHRRPGPSWFVALTMRSTMTLRGVFIGIRYGVCLRTAVSSNRCGCE